MLSCQQELLLNINAQKVTLRSSPKKAGKRLLCSLTGWCLDPSTTWRSLLVKQHKIMTVCIGKPHSSWCWSVHFLILLLVIWIAQFVELCQVLYLRVRAIFYRYVLFNKKCEKKEKERSETVHHESLFSVSCIETHLSHTRPCSGQALDSLPCIPPLSHSGSSMH